ncbi:DUF2752 domain-containing protein [Streptomyces sp. 71268]|uniref:DUF2752 domain-containing protein n=1 Tax=Streptomyces sp. 71268 TaxID=3002640 RepID=UPI0023F9A0B3|nr:DUF2752 domain-containing protein [Streptomyces sp. 71268]WEV28355.1 DUF2752 domain-containing protein [Streptomyces sp. 71268]
MSEQLRPVSERGLRGAPPRRLLAPLAVLAAVVTAFAGVATVDPYEPGHYPACPMLQYTGVLCPGCGGLRSAHSVAHGDFAAALGANALAVAGYVAFATLWTCWFVRRAARHRTDGPGRGARRAPGGDGRGAAGPRGVRYLGWVVGLAVLAFTLVRNLPFGTSLAP